MKKININNTSKKLKFKEIGWIAFRELFEELKDFSIEEKTMNLFYNKFDCIMNMNANEQTELFNRWNNRPYIYNGNLNNYEKDIKVYK